MKIKFDIAIIDDEPQITEALERLLKDKFNINQFNDPLSFIEFIKNNPTTSFAVIITDQKMPKMSGTELLSQSLHYQPLATRILLTGYSDLDSVIAAINEGHVYRYIHKPWEPHDLIATVTEAAEKYALIIENQKKTKALEIANTELKKLDEAKNQFMVLINHELKTPLTGIISYLELLKESPLTEEQKKYVTHIESNAQRLHKLIQDSLLIVSAESKLLKPDIQKFDPHRSLDLQLSQDFNNLVTKKSLKIQYDLGNELWIGDPKLISQVMRRLLENAVRFANPNSDITLQTIPSSAHRITITIRNQGPHVTEETIQNLGKPFYLDEDIMKHSQGTGLGLSIVVALLKLHNSALRLSNTKDGVEAEFQLPCLNKN